MKWQKRAEKETTIERYRVTGKERERERREMREKGEKETYTSSIDKLNIGRYSVLWKRGRTRQKCRKHRDRDREMEKIVIDKGRRDGRLREGVRE